RTASPCTSRHSVPDDTRAIRFDSDIQDTSQGPLEGDKLLEASFVVVQGVSHALDPRVSEQLPVFCSYTDPHVRRDAAARPHARHDPAAPPPWAKRLFHRGSSTLNCRQSKRPGTGTRPVAR